MFQLISLFVVPAVTWAAVIVFAGIVAIALAWRLLDAWSDRGIRRALSDDDLSAIYGESISHHLKADAERVAWPEDCQCTVYAEDAASPGSPAAHANQPDATTRPCP